MPKDTATEPSEKPSRLGRLKSIFYIVWAVIGIILLAVGVAYALGTVAAALAIITLAAFIVFLLRIPVAWLERYNVPRGLGTLLAYVGALLLITLILLLFIPIIWEQSVGLIKMLPEYIDAATAAFNSLYMQYGYLLENNSIHQVFTSAANSLSDWAGDLVSQVGKGAINVGTGVATSFIVLTVSLIVGFWILMDLPKIGRELRVIIGPKHEDAALFITTTVSNSFGGYLRGMTLCALCTGTVAGIGFYFIGLPYPAVLGLLTGLLNFIPYIGPWIAGLIAAIIGLFISPLTALLSIIITVAAQQLVDNFIYPRVMSSAVKLHPAIVLVGVFTGGAIGGIIGLIAAVPLLASAKIIFVHFFEKRTGRTLMSEKGAFFKGASTTEGETSGTTVGSGSKPLRDRTGETPTTKDETPGVGTNIEKNQQDETGKSAKKREE
jgi:predicted PurR-regulated permease PerM